MTIQEKITSRKCSFCKSKEGKLRPIGNYIVELKELEIQNETKLACQSCYVSKNNNLDNKSIKEKTMKIRLINYLKKIIFTVSLLFTVGIAMVQAQGIPGPPGFPGPPDAAPIDGGLGLLAAAGGAYAYKKLKGKRKEEGDI